MASPAGLTLDAFVEAACSGKVTVHEASVWREGIKSRHYDRGRSVWTAPRYVAQEREQIDATEEFERRRYAHEAQEAERERRSAAPLSRQQALIPADRRSHFPRDG
jgi:hypothetical protein